jgi:cyclic pyranopterin phosphate synthase
MTTNGIGLAKLAEPLARAGLDRINVSLDTLSPERFARITRRDRLSDVLAGLEAAAAAGLAPVKINTVLLRGINDDEAVTLLRFALRHGYELRFIEQMPLDAGHTWSRERMVTADEILAQLEREFELLPDPAERAGAPAETFLVLDSTASDSTASAATACCGTIDGTVARGATTTHESAIHDSGPDTVGTATAPHAVPSRATGRADGFRSAPRVGIIASVTRPFCGACDRTRLTADGQIRNCLFAREESDLRTALRGGASDEEIAERWRVATLGKAAGHGIDDPSFLQPSRSMSAIGG